MKNFLEVYNGLSAILVDKSKYDGMWVSSLTHSAAKGLPDTELVSLKERVDFVEEIRRITTKPIIVDVDTMGDIRHVPFYTKWFLKAGAYAIVIEDKKYPKENSLLRENNHQLEDVDKFCEKIRVAKENAGEMKIIARLESLIAKHSIEEALIRAEAYVKAGVDMILIHSKEVVNCLEVMEFASRFRKISKVPMVAIPTTYILPESHSFEIVITANHLLRVSLKAMQKFLAGEEVAMASVQDIFDIVGN